MWDENGDWIEDYSVLEDNYDYNYYDYNLVDPSLPQEDYSNVIGTDTTFGEGIINLTSEMGSGVLGDTTFGQQVIEASHAGDTSPLFDGVLKVSAPIFVASIGTALNKMVSGWFGGTPNTVNRPPAPTGYHYDNIGRLINNTTGQPLVGNAIPSSGLSIQNILLYGVGAFAGYKVLKAVKIL